MDAEDEMVLSIWASVQYHLVYGGREIPSWFDCADDPIALHVELKKSDWDVTPMYDTSTHKYQFLTRPQSSSELTSKFEAPERTFQVLSCKLCSW